MMMGAIILIKAFHEVGVPGSGFASLRRDRLRSKLRKAWVPPIGTHRTHRAWLQPGTATVDAIFLARRNVSDGSSPNCCR